VKKITTEMSKLVWILDDDYAICEAIKVILEDIGHKVERFETGAQITTKLNERTPNIILMDVLLTNENGIEISSIIKKKRRFKDLVVILMSANALQPKDVAKSHAKAFLRKPFDIYDLIDLVEKYA
jgi:DNA-binding NtrC family response regulator